MEDERPGGATSPPEGGEDAAGAQAASLSDGFRRVASLHRDARRRNVSALIVLHTPWGGGIEGIVKDWRRHLLGERESLFEAVCRPGGGTYAPLRDIVSRYVRSLDDLGLLDEEIRALVGRVSGVLGLPALPGIWQPSSPPRSEAGGQLQFFEHLGRLFLSLGSRLPASLLFQDIHRADSATRVALQYLCDAVFSDALTRYAPSGLTRPRFGGTVVITTTDAAIEAGELRDLLGDRDDVHFLSVRTAEEATFRDELQSDTVVTGLMKATGGSVEALRELLRAMPAGVEDLFLRQLEALQPSERAVLEALAVLGRPARPDFLLRVAGVEGDAPSLSALAEQRLITRQVTRGELLIDFPSVESRLRLYETVESNRRADLHARVAGLIEERARLGEAVDLEVIAHHYLHSNVGPKAIRYALDAAERLHISYAFQRAAEILNALLDMPMEDVDRRVVLERLVEVCVAMGDNDAALQHNETRIAVAVRADLPSIHRRHGEILTELGSYDDALTSFEAAEAALQRCTDEDVDGAALEMLCIRASRGEAFYGKGEYERATETVNEALALSVNKDDADVRRVALRLSNTLGKVHLFLGDYARALEVFQSNHRLARERGWADEEVRALFNQATIALQQRRYEDAERIFQDCIAFGEETANPLTRAFCLLNLAVVYHKTLRYADALEAYLHGLTTFRQSGNELQFAVTAMNLGALYETIGDRDRARALLEVSIDVSTRRDIKYFRGRAYHILGLLELGSDRPVEAQQRLARAQDILGQTGSRTFRDRIRIAEARAAHGIGNRAQRDRIMQELTCEGEDTDAREVRAERDLFRGLFLLEDGRPEQATTSLEEALAVLEELNVHEHIWRARLYLAECELSLGRKRRGRAYLQSASDLIDHISLQLPEPLRTVYQDAPERALVRHRLLAVEQNDVLPPTLMDEAGDQAWQAWRERYASIIGEDDRLIQMFRIIDRVAESESTVLIQGESGTGKELVAEAIHGRSQRVEGPFVKVNCAAFVEALLLSELFGHERGAFTGALSRKKGRFELAEGGTLFLDEIGDISQNTQVALLRVLQERTFERVGGSETVDADVRIICATNRNLEEMVRTGNFRLDLYYRLKGVVLELPPLRERRRDIPLLVQHFCRELATDGRPEREFSEDAMGFLVRYSWPGNVRELENFLRSMLLFVEGDRVELRHILQFRDFFADGGFAEVVPAWLAEEGRAQRPARTTRDFPALPPPAERPEHGHGNGNGSADRTTGAAAEPLREAPPADRLPLLPENDDDGADERIATWALDTGVGLPDLKKRLEVALIREALIKAGGNVTHAARLLDMKRPRLSQVINGTPELEQLKRRLSEEPTGAAS